MGKIYVKEYREVSAAEYSQMMRRRKAAAINKSIFYRRGSGRDAIVTVTRGAYIPDLYIIDGRLYKHCLIDSI